jgi:hypothetical protein
MSFQHETEYIQSLGIHSTFLRPVQTRWRSYAQCRAHNANLLAVSACNHNFLLLHIYDGLLQAIEAKLENQQEEDVGW